MDMTVLFLGLAIVFGLYMAWSIGANDVANAMATSVGSRALTFKQAIIVAAIFEFLGAFLAGGGVTSTIRKGIIDSSMITDPNIMLYGMLAALLAAAVWLTVASRFGWPVSTTHSIVGAIVGFAWAAIGIEAIHFDKVAQIAASWVVSPLMSGSIAFLLVLSVRWLILDREDPDKQARIFVPFYIFLTALNISLVTFLKGLKYVGLEIDGFTAAFYSIGIATCITVVGVILIRSLKGGRAGFTGVESTFSILMIVTASAMAFAHGSNDVANAIGPVAAIVSIVNTGVIAQTSPVSPWVLFLGGAGIVIGLATFGQRVMATVGTRITELTPSRGFAAELSAATTVVLASGTGLPISTTHTLVGAVLGVGLARGLSAINLGVIKTVVISWLVTLPAGAILSIIFYFVLSTLFA